VDGSSGGSFDEGWLYCYFGRRQDSHNNDSNLSKGTRNQEPGGFDTQKVAEVAEVTERVDWETGDKEDPLLDELRTWKE